MGAQRTSTLRVFIVHHHAVFRQALGVVLDAQPDLEVVALAGSPAEASALLAAGGRPADVAVVDLGGPHGGGADGLVTRLVASEPGVAVLAIAERCDLERRGPAFGAGAGEVLTKAAGLDRILDALRRLGGRER